MSGFKYPYTCDTIDREIGKARGELISTMIDIFKEHKISNNFDDAHQAGEELYSVLSDVFENIRMSNQNIRCAADKQLREKDDEVIELRAKIFLLQKQLNELNN